MAEALRPIAGAFAGEPSNQRSVLLQLGYSLATPPADLGLIATAATALEEALSDALVAEELAAAGLGSDADADGAVQQVFLRSAAVVTAVKGVATAHSAELPDFEVRFYEHVFVSALEGAQPILFSVLVALGIVELNRDVISDGSGGSAAVTRRRFVFSRATQLFTDPGALLTDVYGWGTESIDSAKLFANLSRLATILGPTPQLEYPTEELALAYGVDPGANDADLVRRLVFPLGFAGAGDFALDVYPVPTVAPAVQPLAITLDIVAGDVTSVPLTDEWTLDVALQGDVGTGVGVVLHPGAAPTFVRDVFGGSGGPVSQVSVEVALSWNARIDDEDVATDRAIFSMPGGASVRAAALRIALIGGANTGGVGDVALSLSVEKGRFALALGEADGFVQKSLSAEALEVPFQSALSWSRQQGVHFSFSGGLEARLAVSLSIGPVAVEAVRLAVEMKDGVGLAASADLLFTFGPVKARLEGIGARLQLGFERGNLGIFDAKPGFVPPRGAGIDIEAGPISGGGFISLKDGRYSGILELRIFEITVKAFGVIDTKMPDGSKGFSFVIVISAEFQPIQLGLGFTLNGVGGLLGINRTLSEKDLDAVLAGKNADALLFPRNLVQNAPQIIEALSAVFPPAEDSQVFGPMAKIGWGTPTLVRADLALVLELPKRVLVILGLVTAQLPKKEGDDSAALVDLHMFVKGELDIPGKSFSLDAWLHDSTVGGFNVSGKMAMRLRWGERPNFLISLGGFHSSFQPPPDVPALERLKVDLGITGNPTITLTGFLAVTSNTVQVGGELKFNASGYGFEVGASVGVQAIFIFAPFSFDAMIHADVHVSFHGVGFTVGMHGHLTGPSPWHVDAKVCASLWFVSACLSISVTIGDRTPEELPTLNPWFGSPEPEGEPRAVIGLKRALEDARNWTPLPGSGTLAVVSRVESAGTAPPATLIDPLDAITVHQRVVPLETPAQAPIRRFGPVKSSGTPNYHLVEAQIAAADLILDHEPNITDQFAPGQFFEIDRTKIVSAPSFERRTAGYTLDPGTSNLEGSKKTATAIEFETFVVDSKRPLKRSNLNEALRAGLLDGMLRAGPASVSGMFRKGTGAFVDLSAPERFDYKDPRFGVTDRGTKQPVPSVTPTPVTKIEALVILDAHLAQNPADRGRFQVSRVDPVAA